MKKTTAILVVLLILTQSVMLVRAWDVERPDHDTDLNRTIHPTGSSDGNAAVAMGVTLRNYDNHSSEYGESSVFSVNVSMVANSRGNISYYDYGAGSLDWKEITSDRNVITYPGGTGDDNGTWVGLPAGFSFRFYGAEYRAIDWSHIWVCTNGFVSFDLSNSTTRCPSAFPSKDAPNAVIAPLWTDLVVDDQASIITGMSDEWFVVTWNYTRHKQTNARLTFQVALQTFYEQQRDAWNWYQGQILMSYQQVGSISGSFANGIEDHEGRRGWGGIRDNNWLQNVAGKTILLKDISNVYSGFPHRFIKNLTIAFNDSNSQSYCVFPNQSAIRGYNMKSNSNPPPEDPNLGYLLQLAGTATLLLDLGGVLTASVSKPTYIILCGLEWVDTLAYMQYGDLQMTCFDKTGKNGDHVPDNVNPYGANVTAQSFQTGRQATPPLVTDATLSTSIYWILNDDVTFNHTLGITATVQYCEYDPTTHEIVDRQLNTSTVVNVFRDNNGSPQTSDQVALGTYGQDRLLWLGSAGGYDTVDYYRFYATQGTATWIDVVVPSQANFDLYLYKANDLVNPVASSTKNASENEAIGFLANYTGYHYIQVTGNGGCDFYNMTLSQGAALNVSTCYWPPGAGNCTIGSPPINVSGTYVYRLGEGVSVTAVNNTGFVFGHWVLDGTNNFSNPVSLTMNSNHNLQAFFASANQSGGDGQCPILHVWDGNNYVGLEVLGIHNPTGEDVVREATVPKTLVRIANYKAKFMLQEGWPDLNFSESTIDQVQLFAVDMFGNRLPCPLIIAQDSRLGNVLLRLLLNDEQKVQTLLLDRVELEFLTPYPSWMIQNYTFVIEGCNQLKQ